MMKAQITNLPLWQAALEQWLKSHRNPRDIAGLLALYQECKARIKPS